MAELKDRDIAIRKASNDEMVVVYNEKIYTLDEIGSALNAYEVKKKHIKKAKQKAAQRKKDANPGLTLIEEDQE